MTDRKHERNKDLVASCEFEDDVLPLDRRGRNLRARRAPLLLSKLRPLSPLCDSMLDDRLLDFLSNLLRDLMVNNESEETFKAISK